MAMFRLRAQFAREGGWRSGRLLTMASDRGTRHRLCAINPETSPPSSQEILPAMPLAPPVGVVIANHNNCGFIEKAIESDEVIRRCLARLGDTRFRYVKLGTNLVMPGSAHSAHSSYSSPPPGGEVR